MQTLRTTTKQQVFCFQIFAGREFTFPHISQNYQNNTTHFEVLAVTETMCADNRMWYEILDWPHQVLVNQKNFNRL